MRVKAQVLQLFLAIQDLLIKVLNEGQEKYQNELLHLLLVSLKLSIARRNRPTVLDEARNIYSYILRPDILKSLIDFSEKVSPVFTPDNLLDMNPMMKKIK